MAHTNAPRAKYRLNDARTRQHKTRVRPTNMVAEQVTTTDQLVEKTVEVPKEKDAYKVAQEKYKKQMNIPNNDRGYRRSIGKNVKVIPQDRMSERTVLAGTR